MVTTLDFVQKIRTSEYASAKVADDLLLRYEEIFQSLCSQDSDYKLFRLSTTTKADELELHLRKCKQGIKLAPILAGISFHVGNGTVNDAIQAYMYYNIASLHGVSEAGNFRNMVSARMKSEEISHAQELTRRFVTRYLPQYGAIIGQEPAT
jgi:hypothetical protein